MALELIQSAGDPQVGNLATPINASGFTKAFINSLPAYRKGLTPSNRGLEIGMAHGYFLYGPFALLGPLRSTDLGAITGLLAAVGVISVMTIAISLYSGAGANVPASTVPAPETPAELATKEGWSELASGFLLGGCGGALFAYLICQTPHLLPLQGVISGVWSS